MAFAQIIDITTTPFGANTTDHVADLPAVVQPDQLLIALWCNDGNAAVTTPDGWTLIFSATSNSQVRFAAYALKAAGSEGGGTVNFVTAASETGVAKILRFANWYGTIASGVAQATAGGNNDSPNPPLLDPASWDVEDTVWIACFGEDFGDALLSYPANYGANQSWNSSAAGSGDCGLGMATRNLAASSENPGTFSVDAGGGAWVAATIAVRPGTAGPDLVSVEPSGIATAQAFGTPSVRRNISPSGIGTAEAFGTPKINRNIKPTGIASAEAIGALGVIADVIYPTSIPSQEAFGTASVRYPQTVSPSSIASAEAIGTPAVRALVRPVAIDSEERFGLAVVSNAPILTTGAIYVEVYDRYGNLLGEGPIADIARASTIERLDRLGEFSFEFPATDPRAALLDHGREIRIYREGEGEIFRGIVESLETVEDE